MNSQIAAARAGAIIFALVCLGHLWRVLTRTQMLVGSYQIPIWTSSLIVLISGSLSIWLWKVSLRRT